MRKHYCEFDENLYIGASVRDVPLVKWRLTHGRGQFSIYVICEAATTGDQLDIMHCGVLKQKYYRDNPVHVYGIANGRAEAMDMIVTISHEASECGMDGNLIGYIKSRSVK